MPTVDFVEKKIAAIEGFAVRVRYSGPARSRGRDVRGDRADLPTYPLRNRAQGTMTVAAWIEKRFHRFYPGYSVEVLNGEDKVVHGKSLLNTVRRSYR